MKQYYGLVLIAAMLNACATVDVEKKVYTKREAGSAPVENEPAIQVVPIDTGPPEPAPPPIIIEQPVYVPAQAAQSAAGKGPAAGVDTVATATRKGILKPEEYSHAAIVYDYDANWVYEVYGQPLRAVDILLEPGEIALEPVFVSDSERWLIGGGVNLEGGVQVQHIYVKPAESGLQATLVINTDRRVYHIILRSYVDVHMPIVRWKYPRSNELPQIYAKREEAGTVGAAAGSAAGGEGGKQKDEDEDYAGVDARYLSFNYRIRYGLFQKPRWLPELAYDDGRKTYIIFPEGVLQGELPGVFENRNDIVNYRVVEKVVIIDKLIETVTVRLDGKEITVEKKKGKG